MNNFTPAQNKVIETWTEKRDTLLREIGALETELSDKRKETTQEGINLDALHKSIAEAKGRLTELQLLEDRHKTSVSIEVSELEARKSRLEAECLAKEEDKKKADIELSRINASIAALSNAHNKMADQAAIVNRVVGEIIETSVNHASETKKIMSEVQIVVTQVIEKGNENVKQTGIVLEKLPRYIFELQKPIRIRRAYATPKGTIIRPEPITE
jgi:chromosome segregation ATPase